ncbi:hypothetical protein DUZ99_17185 [Xylanibacillus composti]|nr:phosphotransferase [Xylanibacillus composti]MDT9726713.1 hypothetical protein [Xylanibacillus composti]
MDYFRIPARSFNSLEYDDSRNQVTKRSMDKDKLRDEIRWYLHVPDSLQRYLPQIIDFGLEDELYLTMAWVRLPTVHQLYMDKPDDWRLMEAILGRLQDALACMSLPAAPPAITREQLTEIYVNKTMRRLVRLHQQQEWVRHIYARGSVVLNGSTYPCPIRYLEENPQVPAILLERPVPRIVHGDLCFPNMFFDERQEQLILIDPRGAFGVPGIYGDGRYDLAKVRHSLSGYDCIIANRFQADASAHGLTVALAVQRKQAAWREAWDDICGPSLEEIRMAEALLFLSMASLHADHPRRQVAMYGLGTKLLFDIVGE